MLGVESEIGTSALRLWVAAGSAALLIVFCVLASLRPPARMAPSPVLRAGLVVVCAILGAAITWAFLDRGDLGNRGAERRAFEMRAEELSARVLAPGSPLACLDAVAGENVEAACEKALFASPASVASASSYAAARLTLLASMAAYAGRGGSNIDDVLLPLRRSLEADRFGFLAHVLAVRDGCTNQNCKALAVLRDASRVRANLSAETLDRYLEHYLVLWAAAPDGADGAQAPSATAQPNTQGPRKAVSIDFPTAASIPAVSIMNPEPTGPVLPGVAAAAASNPNPQAAPSSVPHRARKQTSNPPAPAAVQAVSSGSPAPEPIWPEPVPPPPSPQPAAASASAGPIQLNPPSPAATTLRTQ
jgi:hypothetical protein